MSTADLLPSWRPGATRDALVGFLDAVGELPPERRLAVFDNDGTLWCEKPRYVQLDFFLAELGVSARARPELAEVPEYRALLTGDQAAIADFGLARIATALLELFEGQRPEDFDASARAFFRSAAHPDTGRPYAQMVYRPMLELLAALEARGVTTAIATGGGTEFVRAVSERLYRVPPERVVGTLVAYDVGTGPDGPVLRRTTSLNGPPNEGPAKVANIQTALGRRPALAGGNSAGDTEMLAHAVAGDGPSLALVVDHDDAEREYAYESEAGSFVAAESLLDTARREGWTIVSMRDDWATVF